MGASVSSFPTKVLYWIHERQSTSYTSTSTTTGAFVGNTLPDFYTLYTLLKLLRDIYICRLSVSQLRLGKSIVVDRRDLPSPT